MLVTEVIFFLALVVSSQAFWWTSGSSNSPETESIDTPAIKPVPLGYFRMYAYQPLVPIATARSYLPYQPTSKFLNDPLGWQRAYSMPQMTINNANRGHAAPLIAAAAVQQPQNQNLIRSSQTILNTVNEDAVTTKIVSTIPTTTQSSTIPTMTTENVILSNNELSIDRIDNSESLSLLSTLSTSSSASASASASQAAALPSSSSSSSSITSHSQSNLVNPSLPAVHVSLPQYSQPLPDHPHMPHLPHLPHHVPYVPMTNYQNPHVQYMPCMCPVTVGIASEVVPSKPIESREDDFDAHIMLSDDFQN